MFEIKNSGPDIPDGSYPAVLERIEQDSGKFGPMLKWHWLVEVPAHDGKDAAIESLSQMTSANTGTGSTTYKQLKALLQKDLKAGDTAEDPTGSSAILVISRNDKGFPKVTEVLPKVDPQQVLPGVPR